MEEMSHAKDRILALKMTPRQVEVIVALYELQEDELSIITSERIAEKLGIAKTTAWDLLSRMKKKRAVANDARGWHLCAEVRRALRELGRGVQ